MKPLYELLKKGPLDTLEVKAALMTTYSTTICRLYKLRARGIIKDVGVRPKDGHGKILIWAVTEHKPKIYKDGDMAVAGRITIGRGSRWYSGIV